MTATRRAGRVSPHHVVCEDGGATAHCLHCDQKFSVRLPAPVSVWAAAMKEFCKIHRACKPSSPRA